MKKYIKTFVKIVKLAYKTFVKIVKKNVKTFAKNVKKHVKTFDKFVKKGYNNVYITMLDSTYSIHIRYDNIIFSSVMMSVKKEFERYDI